MVQLISFVEENVEPGADLPGGAPNKSGEPNVDSELVDESAAVLACWHRLRNGCRFPAWSDLQQCLCAANWPDSPDSIVIGYRGIDGALELEKMDSGSSNGRLVREPSLPISESRIDLSSTMLQWVRAVAGEAVRVGRPMADSEAFPSSAGDLRYRVFVLPFTGRQTECFRVFCTFHRVT